MGMIDRFIGMGSTVTAVGNAASSVAEVFRENETRRMELDEEAYARAIGQYGQEFVSMPQTWFDSLVNGLNRLPRPVLTMGVLGLFIYAMVEPDGFSVRMEGLQLVPEPLWWLLGAIVSFYFGAREAHYFRNRVWPARKVTKTSVKAEAAAAGGAAVGTGAAGALVAGGTAARTTEILAEDAPAASAAEPDTAHAQARVPAGNDGFADNAALRDWLAAIRG